MNEDFFKESKRTFRNIVIVVLILISSVSLVAVVLNLSTHKKQNQPTEEGDEIKSLPGLSEDIQFRQFSGYLKAGHANKTRLHYWFVESQGDPAKDPVLLWLNGGPGCSSMGGLFEELGPFRIKSDGKTLTLREASWNKLANVLFFESPLSTGFSYAAEGESPQTDDTTTDMNYVALKSFFEKFPQYKRNSLYLTGESYAGVYIPTLALRVDADTEMNLKGIAIGNGVFEQKLSEESLIFFALDSGLVSDHIRFAISKSCCQGQPLSREDCQMNGPNSPASCHIDGLAINYAIHQAGLSNYNIYAKCAQIGGVPLTRGNGKVETNISGIIDLALLKMLPDYALDDRHSKERSRQPSRKEFVNVRENRLRRHTPICIDMESMSSYLNSAAVREAIHIPKSISKWEVCSDVLYQRKYVERPNGLKGHFLQLVASKKNLTMLLYNGDADAVCNHIGNEWFVDGLGLKVVGEKRYWRLGRQAVGKVKQYEGITLVTIERAGHMVPQDKPEVAFHMIEALLGSEGRLVYL